MAASDAVDSRPKCSFWARVDRWMRSIHLYSGLFLVPWMMVGVAQREQASSAHATSQRRQHVFNVREKKSPD